MPVTKTAKRALRSSTNKKDVNKRIVSKMEIAVRVAKKSKKEVDIKKAISLSDRAAKKHVIHKNKASHIKSSLSKLLSQKAVKRHSSTTKKAASNKKGSSKKN